MIRTVYDPCCGSGGMLTIAKERILEINPSADVHLFGQEVNPETYAVCKSDLYMKSADGRDAENITFGSDAGQRRTTPTARSTTCSPIRRTARTGRSTRRRSRPSTSGATPVGSGPGCRGSATASSSSSSTCSAG